MHETTVPDIERALGHEAFLRNLARSLVGSEDQADDLVQEAYVAALGADTPPRHLRGWLAGVVRRRAVGLWRRRDVEARHEPHVARDVELPSVAEVQAREALRRAVVEALLRVREPSRTALLLRYYEGLPPREVAARLDVPVETVRTRTKRGLAAMREDLDESQGDRTAWSAPLLASVGLGSATATLPGWVLGAVAAALLGGVVGLAALVASPGESQDDGLPGDEITVDGATPVDDGPGLAGRVSTEAGVEAAEGTARVVGRVLLGGEAVAATVALRRLATDAIHAWDAIEADFAALRRPPLRQREVHAGATFDLDRAPTGLLGCTNPATDYASGHNLFDEIDWQWLLAGSYYNFAVLEPDQITVTYPNGQFEVRDWEYRLSPDPQIRGDVLQAVSAENARFYR